MTDEERQKLCTKLRDGSYLTWNDKCAAADELERLAALAQSDAEPVAWKPDANMRAELDRSEMVARAMLKEIMKQIDHIETEGHIEWHKRIYVNGELYLPDISAAVLASFYAAPPHPDASAGMLEAAEIAESLAQEFERRHNELKKYSPDNHHRWIDFYPRIAQGCEEAAQAIRSRAADRSGK